MNISDQQRLIRSLDLYFERWAAAGVYPSEEERARVESFKALVNEHASSANRDCFPGHLTGSAIILTPQRDKILLTLHRKLGRWLQLGGHADGDWNLARVAHREGIEESGLESLELVRFFDSNSREFGEGDYPIFDLDVHAIPARGDEPAHFHYDARFLFVAPRPEAISTSEESTDLKWWDFDAACESFQKTSMDRILAKWAWSRNRDIPQPFP